LTLSTFISCPSAVWSSRRKEERMPWQTQLMVVRLTLQHLLSVCNAVNEEAQLTTGSLQVLSGFTPDNSMSRLSK